MRKVMTPLTAMLLLVLQVANAQPTIPAKIVPDSLLHWEYFTGKVDSSSEYAAMTYWYVYNTYKVMSNGDTAFIDLQAQPLFGDSSWVKLDKISPELLQHEQGHFDFAVLLASEFKRTIDSTTFLMSDYHEKIKAIFSTLLEKYKAIQIQYDEETKHMLKRKKQKMWNAKIKLLLAGTAQ